MAERSPFCGKLLVCDMDGTLLNQENLVSKENKDAIEYFVRGGGKFSLATGRSANGIKEYVNSLPVNVPVILMNGAQIYDFQQDRVIWKSGLEEDIDSVLKNLINEFPGLGIEVFNDNGVQILRKNDVTEWHRHKESIMPGVFGFEDIPKPWYKIVLAWDNSSLKRVEEFLRGKTGTSRSVFAEEVFLDLLNHKTSKGAALKHLAGLLEIPSDHVIAMGDNLNDLEMIEFAGTGVAVENANHMLKKSAQLCTVSHNSHAVAHVVRYIENNVK